MKRISFAMILLAFGAAGCGAGANQQVDARVPPAARNSPSPQPESFVAWKAAFRTRAIAQGISPGVFDAAFQGVGVNADVVRLDGRQAEFTKPIWEYLDSAASPTRVETGRAKRRELGPTMTAIEARYGVDGEAVLAIWGMESNYGANRGDIPVIESLATLAYEGRRRSFAEEQLVAALRILQAGDVTPAEMRGSWAGAMGQNQFMPSSYMSYAVDGDGDGRRDIWGSIPDVAASTAHFLEREGWVPGETWGTEVQLPPGFDHARAELSVRQSTAQWAAEGVRAMDGNALPDLASASILAPAGARGPAFLVGKNFRTILRYNNSTNYALAVALLSQRLSGGPGVVAEWPRDLQPLSREQTRQLQAALNAKGFDTGTPDGVLGPATRAGLRKYQQSQGLVADGYPTLELLRSLAPAGTTQ